MPERENLRADFSKWAQPVLWSAKSRPVRGQIRRFPLSKFGREFVCFLGVVETNIVRSNEKFPLSDLIHYFVADKISEILSRGGSQEEDHQSSGQRPGRSALREPVEVDDLLPVRAEGHHLE